MKRIQYLLDEHPYMRRKLAEAQQQIARFEQRFGCSLAQLEAASLLADASPADHVAYLDWVCWQTVANESVGLPASKSNG